MPQRKAIKSFSFNYLLQVESTRFLVSILCFLKQSDSTLWRLKFFVKEALENHGKNLGSIGGSNENNANNKRRKDICDAIAKTSKKKTKKPKE